MLQALVIAVLVPGADDPVPVTVPHACPFAQLEGNALETISAMLEQSFAVAQ